MENMKKYSGLFIITPEKQDSFDEVKGSITSVISENSGNIVGETVMGKKNLAYPIKKRKEAVYYEIIFTAQPETVPKMMRQFRINTDILRTLIDKNE
jgi:small subunit ribosomal protein S6